MQHFAYKHGVVWFGIFLNQISSAMMAGIPRNGKGDDEGDGGD